MAERNSVDRAESLIQQRINKQSESSVSSTINASVDGLTKKIDAFLISTIDYERHMLYYTSNQEQRVLKNTEKANFGQNHVKTFHICT